MSIRLRQICLVAEKLAPVIDDFKAILGVEVCFKDPAVATFGLENSLMPFGSDFVEVVAPIKENTAAGRYLKRRNGDGGYMVICQCDTHETQLARKARAGALKIRTAWEHEGRSFHGMQLHPGDTLLLYTDGITDARDPDHAMFEFERLEMEFRKCNDRPEGLIKCVRDLVNAHQRGQKPVDDQTMVAIRIV